MLQGFFITDIQSTINIPNYRTQKIAVDSTAFIVNNFELRGYINWSFETWNIEVYN